MKNFIFRWIRQRCHWQNLNENRLGEIKGSIFWHGRAWFHHKLKDHTKYLRNVSVCWKVWANYWGMDVDLCDGDSDRDIGFFFGCGLFALWITFEGAFPKKLKGRIQFGSHLRAHIVNMIHAVGYHQNRAGDSNVYTQGVLVEPLLAVLVGHESNRVTRGQWDFELERMYTDGIILLTQRDGEFRVRTVYERDTDYWSRTIGIRYFEGTLWFHLWHRNGGWSSRDPKWWSFSLNLPDFFLGRAKYSKRVISVSDATVPMPEANYPATVTIEESVWKRPRWFALKRLSSEITVEGGIPVPGKGENSWDCDDDAIISTGCNEPDVSAAVAKMVKSALSTRERYGGKNWMPSALTEREESRPND